MYIYIHMAMHQNGIKACCFEALVRRSPGHCTVHTLAGDMKISLGLLLVSLGIALALPHSKLKIKFNYFVLVRFQWFHC